MQGKRHTVVRGGDVALFAGRPRVRGLVGVIDYDTAQYDAIIRFTQTRRCRGEVIRPHFRKETVFAKR
jgi:hypothetical protein